MRGIRGIREDERKRGIREEASMRGREGERK